MAGVDFYVTVEQRNFLQRLQEAKDKFGEFTDSIERQGKSVDSTFASMERALGKIAKTAAATFTVSKAWDFAKQCIEVRSQIESLEISFETLLGNKQKADQLIGEIKNFAATTPMDMSTLAQGAQTMLGFNIEAEKIMPLLRAIGDISMGDAQKFNSLSLAFSQMSATGKLMGQDLSQMINAGFNPLAQISQTTGRSIKELKEDVEKGAISVEMVTKAFMDATSEGGKFNNMLQKQSEGLAGSFAYLRGTVTDAMNEIGGGLEGVTVAGVNMTASLIKNYKTVGEVIMVLVAAYGTYKAALMASTVLEAGQIGRATSLAVAKGRLTAAVMKLNTAMSLNPWGIAAAAATALGYGLYKLATNYSDVEKAQRRYKQALEDTKQAEASEEAQLQAMFGRLRLAKQGTEEYEAAKAAIIKQYGQYLDGLDAEVASLNNINKAYKAISESALKAARARSMGSYIENAANDLAAKEQKTIDAIESQLRKKFKDRTDGWGRSLVEVYIDQFRKVIKSGEKIPTELQSIVDQFTKTMVVGGGVYGGGGTTVDQNPLQVAISSWEKYREQYDKNIKKAQEDLGESNEEIAKTFDATTASLGQLTERLPNAIKELNELKKAEKPDKETIKAKEQEIALIRQRTEAYEDEIVVIKDVKKRIETLEKQQQEYSKNDPEYTALESRINSLKLRLPDEATKAGKIASDSAKANQEYLNLIKTQGQERANEEKEAELHVAQARIDAMSDGMDKTLEQMRLDFEREKYELEREKQQEVKYEINRQKAIFDAEENVKAAKSATYHKRTFDPEADTDMSSVNKIVSRYDQLYTLLTQKQHESEQARHRMETEAMNNYLKEYGTYLEKRQALIDLAKARMSKATTEGEKKTISAQLTRELSDLDIKAKEKTSAVSKLFADMSQKSVAETRKIADGGKQALDFLVSGQWDETKGLHFGITKETFEIWSHSPEKLEEIRKAIKRLNDKADQSETAFNKVKIGLDEIFGNKPNTKEWEDGLQKILSGVQSITQAVSFMSDAMSNIGADGLATGLSEAANVLNSTMQGAQAGAAFGPWGAAAGAALGAVTSLAGAIGKLFDAKHERRIQAMQSQIDTLKKSYDNLGESVERAYSTDASKMIEQQNEMLERQKLLIQNQIKEEEAKKHTDNDRIKAWKDQIEEINDLIAENAEKAENAIFGADVKSQIENFASAYADAWDNGTDRAESAKETVKNMMKQMVTESIKAAIKSSDSMEKIRKKLKEFYEDNVLSQWEQDYVLNMAEQLQQDLDRQFGWAESLLSGNKNNAGTETGAATAGYTTQLSEDTGTEISGRLTAAIDLIYAGNQLKAEGNSTLNNILAQHVQTNEHLSEMKTAYTEMYKMTKEQFSKIQKTLKEQA